MFVLFCLTAKLVFILFGVVKTILKNQEKGWIGELQDRFRGCVKMKMYNHYVMSS